LFIRSYPDDRGNFFKRDKNRILVTGKGSRESWLDLPSGMRIEEEGDLLALVGVFEGIGVKFLMIYNRKEKKYAFFSIKDR
jgi:hypothetical protein